MRFRPSVFVILIMAFSVFRGISQQMDVMMQAWYWDYPKTPSGALWSDTLDQKAASLAAAGFTQIWLPPLCRASFGNNSNGYDPKDLYDLGEYGNGATGFGTRQDLDGLISHFSSVGLEAVADVVYNHRDGGKPENNPALENYIDNYDWTRANTGYNPFPFDRWRCLLPLGGTSGNGAGDYYFKISSSSAHSRFENYSYNVYFQTNTTGWQSLPDQSESEPNGGGDCSQANNDISLGINMNAINEEYAGCRTDEFHLNLGASDFNPAGDTLYIYFSKLNSDYSDMRIYGIWSAPRNANIIDELVYQTYTDFSTLPSGQGGMNFENFKPNTTYDTKLDGDWDWPWFFYDYDQNVSDTKNKLIDWTQWLWTDVGIRGLRMDAVKHFDPAFVADLLDDLHAGGKDPQMIVGEFYDANASVLKSWVNSVESQMDPAASTALDVRAFDFALRESLKNACDAFGYDVRNVFQSGIVEGAGGSGFSAVTFINNHDFRDAGQAVQNDPLLPYVYLLTNNRVGLPCVFYPDYFGTEIPHHPGGRLKNHVDKLIQIHNQYIYGSTWVDYINRFSSPYFLDFHQGYANTTLLYQIDGGGGDPDRELIVAINFAGEALDLTFDLSSHSQLVPGDILVDLVGNTLTPLVELDANAYARISVPARSYGIWANSPAAACDSDTILYVRAGNTQLIDGKSWSTALAFLPAALQRANSCPNIREIWVSEGIYLPTVYADRGASLEIPPGVRIFGGFPATGNPGKNDRDLFQYPTVFSGDIGQAGIASDNSYHVVTRAAEGPVSILDGLYIRSGNANGSGTDAFGGALFNLGPLQVHDVYFEQNQATQASSIYNTGPDAVLEMEHGHLSDNFSALNSSLINDAGAQLILKNLNHLID